MRRVWLTTTLAAVAAGLVSGCGTSGHARKGAGSGAHDAVSATTEAAADHLSPTHISRRLRAQETAIHRQVTAALRAGDHGRGHYGSIPRDLRRRQAAPRNQVLSARPGHAVEPIAGVGVRLRLPGSGSALALAVGPYVPLKDQGSFHNHTTATWRITFSDVHGTVPLQPSMFTLFDEQGQTLHPRVSRLGGGPVPASAPDGRSTTVVLTARTLIGAGTVRYTPAGSHFLVGWDYDAETD